MARGRLTDGRGRQRKGRRADQRRLVLPCSEIQVLHLSSVFLTLLMSECNLRGKAAIARRVNTLTVCKNEPKNSVRTILLAVVDHLSLRKREEDNRTDMLPLVCLAAWELGEAHAYLLLLSYFRHEELQEGAGCPAHLPGTVPRIHPEPSSGAGSTCR